MRGHKIYMNNKKKYIRIKGARENNLKDINLEIPRDLCCTTD